MFTFSTTELNDEFYTAMLCEWCSNDHPREYNFVALYCQASI